MASGVRRGRGEGGLQAWPGYVDALSTLLMVLIFVLLVFVLAQGFLSVALSTRDRALDRLNRQVAELAEMLALERGQAQELRQTLARATEELRVTAAARDVLATELREAREATGRAGAERDASRAERDRLAARIVDLELAARGGAERLAGLEAQLAEALGRVEAAGAESVQTVRRLSEATRGIAAEQAARAQAEARAAALEQRMAEQAAASAQQLAALRATSEQQAAEQRAAAERQRQALAALQLQAREAAAELAAMRQEREALNRQVSVDRATIEARLADIARLGEQIRALTALRDQLERQAREAEARATEQQRARVAAEGLAGEQQRARQAAEQALAEQQRARQAAERAAAERDAARQAAERSAAEQQRAREAAERTAAEQQRAREAAERTAAERDAARHAAERAAAEQQQARRAAEASAQEATRLGESARAQVALLNRQLEELRRQLAQVAAALETAETEVKERELRVADLGQRLNTALAARVEELQRYRSDFFGRLRQVLGERPEVRIVGDRFIFQSEVLFPAASSELTARGREEIRGIAQVLKEIADQIPADIPWVLQVDGHADRTPMRNISNWELASRRAIAVARLLIAEGLPPNRVAAASFGDTQPIDPGTTPEAYARNRRIELRLTDR